LDDNAVPAHPLPRDAAGLLEYLRVGLRCRVWLFGDLLMIGPTHRCPPALVEAVLARACELASLIAAEEAA
jgi:hypothetical protein